MDIVNLLRPQSNPAFPEHVLDSILEELELNFDGSFEAKRLALMGLVGINTSRDSDGHGQGQGHEVDHDETYYDQARHDKVDGGAEDDSYSRATYDKMENDSEAADSEWVDCASQRLDATHSDRSTTACSCNAPDHGNDIRNVECHGWDWDCPVHPHASYQPSGYRPTGCVNRYADHGTQSDSEKCREEYTEFPGYDVILNGSAAGGETKEQVNALH
jgi:hypothetical protein